MPIPGTSQRIINIRDDKKKYYVYVYNKEYSKNYYQRNKDRIKEYQIKNKEKIKEYKKKYYQLKKLN